MAHHLDLKFPNGSIKAEFIRFLKPGECPCKKEALPNHFTQGNKVYKRIEFKY